MNQQQNFNPYFGGVSPAGYGYNQQVNPPKYTQPLTQEQQNRLRQTGDKFSLGLTEEEVLRGICFHRDTATGNTALRDNPDGTCTCTICGYTFDPAQDLSEEDVQQYVNGIIDVLQTIKMFYLDMPVDAASEYFQIIPLLQKMPRLYKVAVDNFSRHEQWNNYRFNGAPNAINLYNMLNTGAYNPMMMGAMQDPNMNMGFAAQQNMYAQPMTQQPMGYGYTPMTGAPIMPGSNGLVNYNMSAQQPMGYASQTPQGFAYGAPQQQQAAPAGTVAPATATTTDDGKTVEVNATFKS